MAAEMDQVERAKFAGDLDDAHIARGEDEDNNTADVRARVMQPEIGDDTAWLG